MNIYIANLSFEVTDEDLRDLFSPYGTINSVKVIIDKETGKSKGFGFVEMPNDEEGQAAIDALNGQTIHFDDDTEGSEAKEIKVSVARPRQQQNNNQGNFRQQNNGFQRRPFNNGGFRQQNNGGFRPRRQYNNGYNNNGYNNGGYNQGYNNYNNRYNNDQNFAGQSQQSDDHSEENQQPAFNNNQGYNNYNNGGFNNNYNNNGYRPRRQYNNYNNGGYNNNRGYNNRGYNNRGYNNYNNGGYNNYNNNYNQGYNSQDNQDNYRPYNNAPQQAPENNSEESNSAE